MSERINRKEEIVNAAASLFFEQGYADTSIQQIVDKVGCTKPALYYHFKEGKEALLREVVEAHFPSIIRYLNQCSANAENLQTFLECYLREMSKDLGNVTTKVRWLIGEFPRFNVEEQEIVVAKLQEQILAFAGFIERYTNDADRAMKLAAFIFPYFVGYSQLFIGMEIHRGLGLPIQDQIENFSRIILASQQI